MGSSWFGKPLGRKSVAHVMSDSHPMAYCMVPPELRGGRKEVA